LYSHGPLGTGSTLAFALALAGFLASGLLCAW
jgi:hypothetical protein